MNEGSEALMQRSKHWEKERKREADMETENQWRKILIQNCTQNNVICRDSGHDSFFSLCKDVENLDRCDGLGYESNERSWTWREGFGDVSVRNC